MLRACQCLTEHGDAQPDLEGPRFQVGWGQMPCRQGLAASLVLQFAPADRGPGWTALLTKAGFWRVLRRRIGERGPVEGCPTRSPRGPARNGEQGFSENAVKTAGFHRVLCGSRQLSKNPQLSLWVSLAHQSGQPIDGSPSKSLPNNNLIFSASHVPIGTGHGWLAFIRTKVAHYCEQQPEDTVLPR